MIKIYMGIPSTGTRSDAQMYTLRMLEQKYKDKIKLVYPECFVGRIFHDHARNKYVEQFLATDCDAIWFLDSDIVPPTNVLDLVTEHFDNWDCAGAPYPVFITPVGGDAPKVVYTVYDHDSKGFHPASIPQSGTAFVDGLATGCLFIKRHVLEKVGKPYFEFKYSDDVRDIVEGEDLGFCRKVRDIGYKFFIDFSMVCKHFKTVDLLDVNNYAIEMSNQAVLAYDRTVRELHAKRKLSQMQPKSRIILP
jgi:GT2 family glycosyltransferase